MTDRKLLDQVQRRRWHKAVRKLDCALFKLLWGITSEDMDILDAEKSPDLLHWARDQETGRLTSKSDGLLIQHG